MPVRRPTPALAALLLATALAPAAARAAPAIPSFVHDGSVTLCTDPTYAPMEFFQHAGDKEPVGFDIDLARAMAKRWGAGLRIISMDFTGLLPGVEAHRCDLVLSGTFLTPERQQRFSGVGYLSSSMVILQAAGAPKLSSPEELAGKVLAVEAGTQYQKRAEALAASLEKAGKKPVVVQPYPGGAQAVQQVATGRAAATLTQDIEAAYRATIQPGQFTVTYTYPDRDVFGAYFARDAANAAIVRDTVAALRADGTIAAIGHQWHIPQDDLDAKLP